ncbi:ATP-binding cassette domain-containing protein [Arthrobacter burdickii]|uniref:ATP-binding cassette domain-containing protein n=1 Tax=Arthrobacter burdickii TaxID=3035920 RepID=A0ABT8JYA7_9MICC|nr:ATP-binding cassette domain-containing protein [Arthrobacter burdickii]MDN4610146.1 ATP-binding cassette domain-containing protein [Arthrobacter burdickii]
MNALEPTTATHGGVTTGGALLAVDGVKVAYKVKGLGRKKAEILHGVSLDLRPGETHGLVGESGSGKSTLGRAILGLAPVSEGSITFQGEDTTHASKRRRRDLAQDIQAVFQDPYSSLSPALTIGDTLAEPLRALGVSRSEASQRVNELLDVVQLPSDALSRYPREFSGGQRQRVAIARALALSPKLIVCDEPVSALDLTTQARVLELLLQVQERTNVALLFISHDLSVVRVMSHRVSVMYRGDIVETGEAAQVTSSPTHPYTQRLLLAAPVADPQRQAERRHARAATMTSCLDEKRRTHA